jgi:hypothetical protein
MIETQSIFIVARKIMRPCLLRKNHNTNAPQIRELIIMNIRAQSNAVMLVN